MMRLNYKLIRSTKTEKAEKSLKFLKMYIIIFKTIPSKLTASGNTKQSIHKNKLRGLVSFLPLTEE